MSMFMYQLICEKKSWSKKALESASRKQKKNDHTLIRYLGSRGLKAKETFG
jgi:hypothetical protein